MDAPAERRARAAERWAFLRPWLRGLQEHLYYHEREEMDCGSLHSELKSFCVYIPWPPATTAAYAATLATLREAMELVALVLRLDHDVWLLIAQEGNPAIELFDPDDYDDRDLVTPSYIIKAHDRWKVGSDTTKTIAVVEQLLVATQDAPRSAEYKRTREKILSMDTRGRLDQFQIPVSLLLAPKAMPRASQAKYMETVTRTTQALSALSSLGARSGAGEYPFKLTDVIFHYWEFPITLDKQETSSIQDYVTMALKRGVSIPELSIKLDSSDRIALGRLLLTVCRPQAAKAAVNDARVDSLIVTMASDEQFVALCSAIASSKSLTRLTTYAAINGDRALKWRALGFALLSRASTSSVREISIQEDQLLLSDAEAFASAGASLHPHLALGGAPPSEAVERQVQLCAQAHIRLMRDSEDLSLERLQLSPDEYYHVVGDEPGSEWMQIFTPGYGVVYARCEDVVDVAFTNSDSLAASPACRLTHLNFAINKCDPGALTSMIQTVAASLVSLDITVKHEQHVRATDIRSILDSCKQIKMFRLWGAVIDSMDVFMDAYEHGQCQVSSLVLKNVHVSNDSLHKFAEALADPTQRIAQTLIEFRFEFNKVGCPGDVVRPDLKGIKKFLNMLALNATLSFFELALDKPFYKRFLERFQDRDRRLLVSHPSDLALSSKLAFLSCVRVKSDQQSKRARTDAHEMPVQAVLERELVERIFMFARKRIYRVVSASPIVSKSRKAIM